MIKFPKDDNKYQWTDHVKGKMVYYGISESLIKRIVRVPKRVEEGVAPKTTAVMQSGTNKNEPQEIWVMYQEVGRKQTPDSKLAIIGLGVKRRIISAWRYPGISPLGKKIPIPDEVLIDLENALREQ
ncbi:MAG: hypothetical protein A2750_03230 [Candidatus Yanofskybacteria bacterium RIFCSPHIGHO2_01_FULL_45_42]|uniref:Uncharacterized protein n=2 Tax=Candidatus Yanofskyibacteriota TaxID=1752733 RepID=A0A1F8FRK4_9BACT|nr:MAG: hypothetical protein A2750_03230 [Candidatus Yanofskybacteria bacterium RIFCSPHIGHO2_01_FULL_45_42]OGN15824.1 MAG: hypothetical protein A3J47_02570 [Candidatus Yanofskybacteria bacterium RIFCSPHIGHO2_02_FULL_43_22]OGN28118.1 MAG: hypothetical protein A3B17_00420 [Candidatus Yanofskybacteria bacterium RIFCSPLOWO2_01_FULL_45_72]